MTQLAPVARMRARMDVASVRPLSAPAAVLALIALAGASTLIRLYLASAVRHGPVVFMDELDYERMAYSLARSGDFSLFGTHGLAFSPLYPVAIAPIYALTSSAQAAYEAVRSVNAVLMSLSAFPLYGIARSVLSRERALGATVLSMMLPLMFYADFEMSENLAYPLFLVAIWAMLCAIRTPTVANDVLVLVATLGAAAARLQNVMLVPAAMTAVILAPAVRPPPGLPRVRAVAAAIVRHWLLFGSCLIALAVVALKQAFVGGSAPVPGGYAGLGASHPSPGRIIVIAIQHFAELDLAVGVVPFAGAMLAAYAFVRFGFPRRALNFAAVAVAVSVCLLVEVAYVAATVDHKGQSSAAPRIHERYLIYLLPLFITAFVAGLRLSRPRISALVLIMIAAASAVAPAIIPFSRVINDSIPVDSFALQGFSASVNGETRANPHAVVIALVVGVLLVSPFLYSVLRARPRVAVMTTAIALFMSSSLVLLVHLNMHLTGDAAYRTPPPNPGWVDAAVNGHSVAIVGGRVEGKIGLWLAAFQNLSIDRLYSTCGGLFGAEVGERRVTLGPQRTLVYGAKPVHASYVLADAQVGVRGHLVAEEPHSQLRLIAPVDGVVRVNQPLRCKP